MTSTRHRLLVWRPSLLSLSGGVAAAWYLGALDDGALLQFDWLKFRCLLLVCGLCDIFTTDDQQNFLTQYVVSLSATWS
jgi:hypothetical protein